MGNTLMSLLVQLGVDSGSFNTAMDKAENKATKTGKGISKALLGIGSGLAVGAAAAITATAAALASTIQPASDLNETVSKVGVVFGEQSGSVIAFGQSAASALGMSTNAALTAAGTYGNLFRSMGMTEDSSAKMSTSLVGLAADLASFNNQNPEEVLNALRAGLTGETEPLKKLGVNLNQALIEQRALDMGLWKGKGTLDAAAKAQASYALIMEQTSLAQGDFARTSGGLANQQRILAGTIENIKASIGTGLLPILQTGAGQLNKYLTDVMNIVGMTGLTMDQKIGRLGGIVSNIANDIAGALPEVADSAFGIIKAIATGMVDALPKLLPAVIDVLLGLVDLIIKMLPIMLDAAMQIIVALANGLGEALPALIPAIVNMLVSLVQILITNLPLIIDAGIKLIMGLIQGIVTALPMLIEQIPALVLAIVDVIIANLPLIITAAVDIIFALIDGLITSIPVLIAAVPQIVSGIVNALIAAAPQLNTAGAEIILKLKTKLGELPAKLAEMGKLAMEGFKKGLTGKFKEILDSVGAFISSIVDKIAALLDENSPSRVLFEKGKNATLGFMNGMESLMPEGVEVSATLAKNVIAGAELAGSAPAGISGSPKFYGAVTIQVTKELSLEQALGQMIL